MRTKEWFFSLQYVCFCYIIHFLWWQITYFAYIIQEVQQAGRFKFLFLLSIVVIPRIRIDISTIIQGKKLLLLFHLFSFWLNTEYLWIELNILGYIMLYIWQDIYTQRKVICCHKFKIRKRSLKIYVRTSCYNFARSFKDIL